MYTTAGSLVGVLVIVLLVGYQRLDKLNRRLRILFYAALSGTAAAGAAAIVLVTVHYATNPPEWDFLIFWTDGTVAARRLNYYDPEYTVAVARPFQPTERIVNELQHRPFLYPPPAILWFLPLGWFNIHTAALIWYAAQLGCLIAAVVLLSKKILRNPTKVGLLITTALLALLYGTYSNIKTAQTLFLLLLLMTLFFRDRNRPLGGIWLGLGILVKPFIAVLLAWLMLKKKQKSLLIVLLTLSAAAFITFAIYGPSVFQSYWTQVHYGALPANHYVEPQNQSLLAWTLRSTGQSGLESTAYIVIALLLTVTTLRRACYSPISRDDLALASCLALGLLIYPGALRSYSVLLLIPILLLCRDHRIWPVAVAYALMIPERGYYVFFASALIWTVLTFAPGGAKRAGRIQTRVCIEAR